MVVIDSSISPDNVWKAVSRNGNILLEGVDTERLQVVTAEGEGVLKYGTASWVYGEELDVQEAMWWRGDSQGLVYYRFDESGVPTYPDVGHDINPSHAFYRSLSEARRSQSTRRA